MRTFLVTTVLLGLVAGVASAHLCNNIYRTPDRIIVKPEKDSLTLEKGEQVRIFVRNNYPTILREVKLTAQVDDPGVKATVTPDRFASMASGEKQAFTVSLQVADGAKQGKYKLQLGIDATSVGFLPVRPFTDDELIAYWQQGNISSHILIAESLARRGNQAGIQKFQELFKSGDRNYTIRGMRCAGRSGNKALAADILPFLETRDGLMKGTAILALGMLKTELDKVEPFTQDPDPFVCACAATALIMADKAGPGVADELANARFLQNQSPYVRVAAGLGCAWAGNKDGLKPIAEGFAVRDADPELTVFSGDALLCLADQQDKKQGGDEKPVAAAPVADEGGVRDVALTLPEGAEAMRDVAADRFFYRASTPLPTADRGGTLRVQLYHSYPGAMHDVTLSVSSSGFRGESKPIAGMRPTEIQAVDIPLEPATAALEGPETSLEVTLKCRELREPVTFSVQVPNSEDSRAKVEAGLSQPVGELAVNVQRFGDLHVFLWGVPLVVVIAATAWRVARHRGGRRVAAA